MFLVNGMRATLRQFNRVANTSDYDDQNYIDKTIKVCPYNTAQGIQFGIYTVPEATGYYIVKGTEDIQEGDQLIFLNGVSSRIASKNQVHTVLKVQDNWIFNRVENKIVAVK